jgi:hypothetical protein
LYADNWFNPKNYRKQPFSRHYPFLDELINNRPEYKLIFHLSNYLPLFLIKLLYAERKDILIEDVGCGNGNLIYYLAKSGFKNFSTFDNWCECPKELFDEMMKEVGVTPSLNILKVNPVVIHNSSAPRLCYIAPAIDKGTYEPEDMRYFKVERDLSNTELICFYCNKDWRIRADDILPKMDFTYLCRDNDELGYAYCRSDKITEFQGKLAQWAL